jgi:hypothetical protein
MPYRSLVVCLLSIVASLSCVSRAKADDLFTYDLGGEVFSWQLPDSPMIPSGNFTIGDGFSIANVWYSAGGIEQTLPGEFVFYNSGDGGGFALFTDNGSGFLLLNEYGPQIYTGMENAPTFAPGTYDLEHKVSGGLPGTLAVSSVPEPASFLLLGSAVLALGIWRRRSLAFGPHS